MRHQEDEMGKVLLEMSVARRLRGRASPGGHPASVDCADSQDHDACEAAPQHGLLVESHHEHLVQRRPVVGRVDVALEDDGKLVSLEVRGYAVVD